MRMLGFALVLAMTPGLAFAGPTTPAASSQGPAVMKITVKVGDKVLTVTPADNETSRDFVSLLPLTVTMDDLFGREKFGQLPRAISAAGPRTNTYEVGEIVYWSPGPDVAIYYRDDGQTIPPPGVIVIGKIDAGFEALNLPGSVKVSFELAK